MVEGTKATPTGVWFLVHHAHQIIAIASFNHHWHCACAVMQSAGFSLTKQTCIKTMLLISLTLSSGVAYQFKNFKHAFYL